MMGAATEKARLPKFSFVLGIESCCEVDDLSCLGMLEKCRRLLSSQIRRLMYDTSTDKKYSIWKTRKQLCTAAPTDNTRLQFRSHFEYLN